MPTRRKHSKNSQRKIKNQQGDSGDIRNQTGADKKETNVEIPETHLFTTINNRAPTHFNGKRE